MLKTYFKEVSVSTRKKIDLVDLTSKIIEAVSEANIRNGLCVIFSPHTTAPIIVNEHESGLLQDITLKIQKEFPDHAGYQHDLVDDNAHAHLAATFFGESKIFPVKDSHIIKGTWQSIFLAEADGPRSRRVIIEIIGE